MLARCTIGAVTQDELAIDDVNAMIKEFNDKVDAKIGDEALEGSFPSLDDMECPNNIMWDEDDEHIQIEPGGDMPEADDFTPDSYDKYI